MNSSNYRFTLDMHRDQSQVSLPVRLGDTDRSLYISLTNGGSAFFIENGSLALFVGKKADGAELSNYCPIENNSAIRYDFTEQTTNVVGVVDCEIRLFDKDGKPITSPRFILVVDSRVGDEDVALSESERNIIDHIAQSEQARINAEAERQAEENVRISNEQARIEAETERSEHEKARGNSEAERLLLEDFRMSAEKARGEAEKSRATAEAERIANEEARVEAEIKREENFSNTLKNVSLTLEDVTASAISAILSNNANTNYYDFDDPYSLVDEIASNAKKYTRGDVFRLADGNGGATIVIVIASNESPTEGYDVEYIITSDIIYIMGEFNFVVGTNYYYCGLVLKGLPEDVYVKPVGEIIEGVEKNLKEYTDAYIQEAILDSWEASV